MHKQGSGLILGKYRRVLIIRINHSYAGLFAYFIYALNQLRYCEKHRLLPVVFFGEDSADGPNASSTSVTVTMSGNITSSQSEK